MDVLWFAPVAVLVFALAALILAGREAGRSAVRLRRDVPSVTALGDEVRALHDDLVTVRARLEARRAAAGPPSIDQ